MAFGPPNSLPDAPALEILKQLMTSTLVQHRQDSTYQGEGVDACV